MRILVFEYIIYYYRIICTKRKYYALYVKAEADTSITVCIICYRRILCCCNQTQCSELLYMTTVG